MYKTCFPILDAILDALRGTCGPTALTKHYLHLVETKRAENTVEAVAKQFGIDLDGEASDFRDAIDLYATEAERQGFINGFQMASLLTGECGGSVSAKAGFIGGLDYPHNFGEGTATPQGQVYPFLRRIARASRWDVPCEWRGALCGYQACIALFAALGGKEAVLLSDHTIYENLRHKKEKMQWEQIL